MSLVNVSNLCDRLNNLTPHLHFISSMANLYLRDFMVVKISWVKELSEQARLVLTELTVMFKISSIYTVQYSSHQPHVIIDQSK